PPILPRRLPRRPLIGRTPCAANGKQAPKRAPAVHGHSRRTLWRSWCGVRSWHAPAVERARGQLGNLADHTVRARSSVPLPHGNELGLDHVSRAAYARGIDRQGRGWKVLNPHSFFRSFVASLMVGSSLGRNRKIGLTASGVAAPVRAIQARPTR